MDGYGLIFWFHLRQAICVTGIQSDLVAQHVSNRLSQEVSDKDEYRSIEIDIKLLTVSFFSFLKCSLIQPVFYLDVSFFFFFFFFFL